MRNGRYWLETLGCPKNEVDSDKLAGLLESEGYVRSPSPTAADLVVVNTCAFIEPARQESIDAVLTLADVRRPGARLVVTGCMAERYGAQLAAALPEVDLVAGFGRRLVPVEDAPTDGPTGTPTGAPTGGPAPLAEVPAAPVELGARRGTRRAGEGAGAPARVRHALRLLRHPLVPGRAALPAARRGPRGGVRARLGRDDAGERGRPRRPGPRLLRQGPHGGARWLGRGCPPVSAGAPRRLRGRARAPHAPRLPLPVGAHRRVGGRRPRHRRALLRPLAAARLPSAARPHAAVGRRGPLLRPHRRHPAGGAPGDLPVVVHPRLPGRDGGGPLRAARVPRGGTARLGGVLHLLEGGGHLRRAPRLPGAGGARLGPPARVRRGAGRDHGPPA